MKLNLLTEAGKKSAIEVSDEIFAREFNESLVHQAVTAFLANQRVFTARQKTRAEVRGGGRKPWQQKGTGRARAGSIRSPIWRGGGVTFAAKERNYSQKMNKKMAKAAVRSVLSELQRQERLIIVESFELTSHKTKDVLAKLNKLQLNDVLIVSDSIQENLYMATRNIPNINVSDVEGTNIVSLITHEKVLMTASAVKQFEELLK